MILADVEINLRGTQIAWYAIAGEEDISFSERRKISRKLIKHRLVTIAIVILLIRHFGEIVPCSASVARLKDGKVYGLDRRIVLPSR